MPEQEASSIHVDFGDAGKKIFSSIEELQKWISKEKEFWAWLQNIPQSHRYTASHVRGKINEFFNPIENTLREALNSPQAQRETRIQQIPAMVESRIKQQAYIFIESPEGRFIDELRQGNPTVAVYTASFMLGVQFDSLSRENIEGAFLAIAYKNGYKDKTKSERASLQTLRAEWNDLLANSKTTFDTTAIEYKNFGEKYIQQLAAQKKDFDEFKLSSQEALKAIVEKSEKELKAIEKTYDEKLAVQASVVYWKKKADSHSRTAKVLSWVSVVVGVLVAGFIGVETFLAIGPLQKLGDLPIWKGAMLILTAVIGVWAIRILVRLLLSNLHLKAEAVERRTMLLTYLALLRREQGPSEKQRELILQILFRPSSTGIIKDDALPPIAAQWLNTVTAT